jgi:hypothetical protein
MTKINIQGSAGGGGGGGVTAVAVAAGTTGSDVNVTGSPITSSGTITVNIPIASAVNTGKLSSSDWAAFNGKQDFLVSTVNIKTINGNDILGGGDLVVGGGTVSSVAVAAGTTGSDVNITGSPITGSGTITVNIPIASAVNTGKLSSTDWAAFNGKQNALILTTTGTTGAATLIGDTLNIPQYPSGTVTSVAVASGTIGSDVNVTGSPITGSGTITVNIPVASAANTGKLSSTDWSAFNAKQDTIILTTTGSSGAATFVGDTLNIPQYDTAPGGANGELQYANGGTFGGALNVVWDDVLNFLGVGIATPGHKLEVYDVANQCIALFEGGQVGAGIAFMDISTVDDTQVGVGAFDNLLCLRGGGNVAGTIQVGNDYATFRGNKLINFVPEIQANTVSFTIDSTNQDNYCGAVAEITGAITVTIDDSVRDGFSVSIIQMDANNTTFAASGGSLTLRNRQGHTQTNGQWATVTLFKNGNNLILAGDTA